MEQTSVIFNGIDAINVITKKTNLELFLRSYDILELVVPIMISLIDKVKKTASEQRVPSG
jgi:membrane protease subunit (stomatin/prohibitin family)